MWILLGALSAIVTAIVAWGIALIFGIHIQSVFLILILPVGGLVIGLGSAAGMSLWPLITGKKPGKGYRFVGAVLGVVGLVLSYYSLFVFTQGGSSFSQWLRIEISSRISALFFGFGGGAHFHIGGIALGSTYNWLSFVIEFLGAAIGGALATDVITGRRRYCEPCQEYMTHKHLANVGAICVFERRREIFDPQTFKKPLLEAIGQHSLSSHPREMYVAIELDWCASCKTGFLAFKSFYEHQKEMKEAVDERVEMPLEASQISDLLAELHLSKAQRAGRFF